MKKIALSMMESLQKPMGGRFFVISDFRKFFRGALTMGAMSLLLLACSVALTGCGKTWAKLDNAPTRVQLSTWGSAEELEVLRGLVSEFEAEHPKIDVEILHIPDNYYQKLHILVAGGLTPDVIFTNSINFPVYASHGVFRDLTPFLAQSPALRREDFFEPSLRAFSRKNDANQPVLEALPRDVSNLVVFYNRDLFKKAGVPEPQAGWTWSDLLKTAQSLTVTAPSSASGTVPKQFGISFYRTPPLFWLPFVWSAGGELFSDDFRQFLPREKQALEGLRFYADLRNRHHVAPRQVESGGATMSQLFLQEKVAMMVSGRWSVPVLRGQAKFNWDVVPLPKGPNGSKVGVDASGYAIAASSPSPNEAWSLVEFLLSKRSVERVAQSGLIVPARPDVANSPAFLTPNLPPAHSRAFTDIIAEGVPTHTPARWNEIAEELTLALDPVWDGKVSAETAIRGVRPKIERVLEVGNP